MFNQFILNEGLNAFEDPAPEPTEAIYTGPVDAAVANALIVERNDLQVNADVAVSEAEVIQEMADVQSMAQTLTTMETLSGSLESFLEHGGSAEQAQSLISQVSESLGSAGVSLSTVAGSLESFDDAEAVKVYLNAGLEALNDTKASIGIRIVNVLTGLDKKIIGFVERVILKAGRMRARAEGVIKEATGRSGKHEVTVSSKFLVTKSGAPSANLVADLTVFTKMINDLTTTYMANMGGYGNGAVAGAMNKIKLASTVAEAKKAVDEIKPPVYPGANITVQDRGEFKLTRTEVTLGGYAVFDLHYKTTGGDSWQEVVNQVKAIGKGRVTIKRPSDEKTSGKVQFTGSLSPQDAINIAKQVIKVCDAAIMIRKNTAWSVNFLAVMAKHIKGMQAAAGANAQSEKGVQTIAYQIAKLPSELMDSVNSLVLGIPAAVNSVCDAALDVADKVSKAAASGDTSTKTPPAAKKDDE